MDVGTVLNSLLMADWRASAEMRGPSTMESSSRLRDKSAEGPIGYKDKMPDKKINKYQMLSK